MLNSSNQIVSAIDYDCWGYPLENRSYQSDNIDYKFTGKLRDAETGYDYFGARYYDARIGRWGGVEPLLEKYISYSPYQYGLLNPMKLVDVDGKDVIVTIEGNNVTITMKMYYTSEGNNGYKFNTDGKYAQLKDYLLNAESEWNLAAQEYNEDSEYKVKFEVFLEEISELPMGENIPEGENTAFYQESAREPGIVNGNQFRIVPLETQDFSYVYKKTSPPHTGAHEFGHIIGLPHVGPVDSDIQKKSTNIMGYNKNRKPPSKDDIKKFMEKVDKNKKRQIIKGDTNNN